MNKEKKALLIGAVLVLVVIILTIGRSLSNREEGNSSVLSQKDSPLQLLSTSELQNLLWKDKENILLVDIRSSDAFVTEHIADSFSVPLDQLTGNSFSAFGGKKIVIVTNADSIKGGVADIISQRIGRDVMQEKNVMLLNGGIEAWFGSTGQVVTAGDPQSFVDQSKIVAIKPEILYAQLFGTENPARSVAIVDVREEQSFLKAHIPGAQNIPLSSIERQREKIAAVAYIVVYGETNTDGFQAGVKLFDLNFFSVTVLDGGFTTWLEKGYPQEAS